MSKKAVTQAEVLSEKPVIPPETSANNEDILDMLMKNDRPKQGNNFCNF